MPSMTKAGYTPPVEPKKKPAKKHVPGKKKRRKKRGVNGAAVVSLAIFLVACLIGAGTLFVYTEASPYAQAFLPGTMLLGYPLEGATMEQASALIDQITAEDLAKFEVKLSWGNQAYALSAEDLSLVIDKEATLSALFARGHEGGMLSTFIEMLKLRQEPMIAQPIVTYDMAFADELLGLIEQDIAREPEDASVVYVPGTAEPFVFTPETLGYSIDLTDVRAQIERAASSVEPAEITLSPQEILPKVTLEDLKGAVVLRSRVLMEVNAQEASYANVSLAAAALDGARIEPGETLSFNEKVGKRTAQRGYLEAEEPAYGEGVSGVGGGVCQVSSALYRAALLGGMTVSRRSPAVYPVAYCQAGQEAAVSDQGIDLVIANPTAYPLFLRARTYRTEDAAWLDLHLSGEAIEGSYALASGVADEKIIEEPVYVRDHEGKYAKYDDERVEGGEARPGYTVVVERMKLDGEGKELSRESISENEYAPIPPAIYIGVQKRN